MNNRLVPLSYQLQSGDQVDIITSTKQKPNEEWLRMVGTARARQKIKSSLNEERKRIASDGREILTRKFKQYNLRFASENITVLEKFYKIPSATELYFQIAKGKVDLTKMRELENKAGLLQLEKKAYVRKKSKHDSPMAKVDKSDTIIIGENFKDIEYKMASCCNPIPGDDVFGFITVNDGIKVHRYSCSNAEHLMSKMAYRCIKARWESSKVKESLASIKVFGMDRIGLVNRITEIISNQHNVNMKSISFETNDGIFEGIVKVLVYDTEHLKSLMHKFEQVEGVQRVTRQSDD